MSGITDSGILYETEPRMNAKDWERVEKENTRWDDLLGANSKRKHDENI